MRIVLVSICALLLPCATLARSNPALASWQNLAALQSGEKVRVVEINHKKASGAFVSFNEQGITIHEKRGDETIARPEVLEVDVHGHRLKHTLIGAAVGAGAGAVVGGAVIAGDNNEALLDGLVVASCSAIGFVAGTVTGVLLPAQKAVYRVR